MAAVASAHLMLQRLHLFQVAAGLQVSQDGLAGFHGGHTCVLAAVQHLRLVDRILTRCKQRIRSLLIGSTGHVAIVGKHTDDGQVMTQAHLKVVGVVSRGDLDHAGALGHIGVLITDNGDLFVQQGQHHMAAVEMGIAGVLAVDSHSGITQHGLRTGSSQLQHLAGLLDRVEQMPEVAVLLLILHLCIRDGGVAVGAPVHHTVAAVDQALVVQTDKHFLHCIRAAFVHGKAFPLPVTAAAQLFQLADDTVAVAGLPIPGALQETIPAHHLLGQPLCPHGLHHLCFGGDGRMVGAGHPQCSIALHPLGTDQDILHGVVHRMAHVQLTGNVGGRHHNGERFFIRVGLCVEIAPVQPELVDPVLHLAGVVLFCKFFHACTSKMTAVGQKSRPTETSMGRL